MIAFTQILCPTDLGELSRRPLACAMSLARRYKAELTVLHVVPTFEPLTVRPASLAVHVQVVHPVSREEILAELQRAVDGAGVGSIDINLAAEAGETSRTIIDQAIMRAADLLVIGTHGRGGFKQFIIGSVAETVLRTAPCPVLTVPPHAAATWSPDAPFKNILCAMDFSPSALQAFGWARDLARQADGVVTVLNVIDWRPEDESGVYARLNPPEYGQRRADDARQRMQALIAGESGAPSAIQELVLNGRPHLEILRLAADTPVDLIVMGAQGRRGLDLTLFGSTTQAVVRAARCPVLTVRMQDTG